MQKISFTYQGNTYTGQLVVSHLLSPTYYWVSMDDETLEQKFGDIAFTEQDDNLHPVNNLLADKYADLFQSIRDAIVRSLQH
jgi:hypothetical protein